MRRTEAGLIATHDGKFLVRTDDRPPDQPLRPNRILTLYSPKFEPLKEFPLPSSAPGEYEMWQVYATATRRSIVVEHGVGRGNEVVLLDPARGIDVRWLDPDTLEPKANWAWAGPETPGPGETGLDFSDAGVAATLRRRANLFTGAPGSCEVAVRRIDGPWRSVFRSDGFNCMNAEFVDEDIVVFSHGGEIHLLGIDGRVLLDQRFGKDEFTHEVRPSANGRRFAIAIVTSKGGNALLDIGQHEVFKRIMVFDIPANSWVYTLDSKAAESKYVSDFALSPDGLRLAVMRHGFVDLYELPE